MTGITTKLPRPAAWALLVLAVFLMGVTPTATLERNTRGHLFAEVIAKTTQSIELVRTVNYGYSLPSDQRDAVARWEYGVSSFDQLKALADSATSSAKTAVAQYEKHINRFGGAGRYLDLIDFAWWLYALATLTVVGLCTTRTPGSGQSPMSGREALRSIQSAVHGARRNAARGRGESPRHIPALLAGVAVFVALIAGAHDFDLLTLPSGVAALAAGIVVYYIAWSTSSKPATWSGVVSELLARYVPVDEDGLKALHLLQADCIRAGHVNIELVQDWVDRERYMIDAREGNPFLDRDLNTAFAASDVGFDTAEWEAEHGANGHVVDTDFIAADAHLTMNRGLYQHILRAIEGALRARGYALVSTPSEHAPAELNEESLSYVATVVAHARRRYISPLAAPHVLGRRAVWDLEEGFAQTTATGLMAAIDRAGLTVVYVEDVEDFEPIHLDVDQFHRDLVESMTLTADGHVICGACDPNGLYGFDRRTVSHTYDECEACGKDPSTQPFSHAEFQAMVSEVARELGWGDERPAVAAEDVSSLGGGTLPPGFGLNKDEA